MTRCMLFLAFFSMLAPARADERSATELLPQSTVLYAELRHPDQLVEGLLDHPLRSRIESIDVVKQAYSGKEFREFQAVVAVVESQIGQTWSEMLKTLAGGGISMAVDAQTQGVALLICGRDEEASQKAVNAIVRLARQDAKDKGNDDPIEEGEYRGIKAYGADKTRMALMGKWLVVTNKGELGKLIIDTYLDQTGSSLATQKRFKAAREQASADAVAWAYVDIETLRNAGVAKDLFAGDAGNPLGELLVGGILSNLQKTPHATASLHASKQGLSLELKAPHADAWVPETRRHYFGTDGRAPAPLQAKDTVLSISAYRDLSEMWLRSGDLFNEQMNDKLAEADSNLSTLFSGKDFGEDILGVVAPGVQLVVTRQLFQPNDPQPAIKLPAFAAVFQLKDPEVMRGDLRRTFQSLVGFLNVIGAMNGQPQLDMDSERQGEKQIITTRYVPEKGADLKRLKINYNFSPSVAFVGDRFVVASTDKLVRELASQAEVVAGDPQIPNTVVATNFSVLKEILDDNRGQLVAQNMLKEGHSKQEAEQQIDILLTILGFFKDANLQLNVADEAIQLKLDLRVAE